MDYHQAFIDIMDDFQKNYSYLSFKKHTVKQLIERYAGFMKTVDNEKDFVRALAKILALFEDGHISLTDSHGNEYLTYTKHAIPNYNHKVMYNKYFHDGMRLENRAGAIGFCGNHEQIVYVNVVSWQNSLYHDISRLFRFFEFIAVNYRFMNKLILDVRANIGGSDSYAQHFLSYLIPEGMTIPVSKYLYRLDDNNPARLGKEVHRGVDSHPKIHFRGQIAVLIGNCCMSSNEFFVMGLESLKHQTGVGSYKNVTLIGDTTFGSSGCPRLFRHLSGISYRIPSWVCYTSQGKLLEGNGVKPDICISSSSTIIRGKDKAFEAALKVLR